MQFVRTLSSNDQNIVIGLVRNRVAAEKAFGENVPKNLSFLEADITDLSALKVGTQVQCNAVVDSVLFDAC